MSPDPEERLDIASAVFGLLQRRFGHRNRPPLDWGAFPEATGAESSSSAGAYLHVLEEMGIVDPSQRLLQRLWRSCARHLS